MHYSKVAGALALACAAPGALAQVSHGGQPLGLQSDLPGIVPVVSVEAPDVEAYLLEDEAMGYRPLRYGALMDMDLSLEDGTWTELADGSRAWRLGLTSPGAHSLSVEFDILWLPEGAEMFVYGQGSEFLGAYTNENHHLDGTFVFEPFAGSSLTIEIDLPAGVEDEPVLETRSVIYDYRDVFGLMDGTVSINGESGEELFGNCLIDVNCPQGDDWENQKRATMRTLSAGALCSGALINNTAVDGTRYVLTADHCGQNSNCVFRFNYQRPGCSSGSAPTNQSVSGCTVLSTNGTYDGRLLRINNNIPDNYEPYFAGWSRGTPNASFAFSMGHPSGGPKKISIDGNGTIRESQFWRVTWSEGTLEGGSSGGPIFDQNGRVRGPACCVNNFTCNQTAFYGRFDRFWDVNNLSQWLDPLGTDQNLLDGWDPICDGEVSNYCSTSPNSVGAGAQIGSTGSNVISANSFGLSVFACPTSQVGIFYYGPNEVNAAFGNGVRCVGGTTIRLPLLTTDFFGDAFYNLDFNNLPPGGDIAPGDTVKFQFWYRDPAAGGAAFNLSGGLSVTFCP